MGSHTVDSHYSQSERRSLDGFQLVVVNRFEHHASCVRNNALYDIFIAKKTRPLPSHRPALSILRMMVVVSKICVFPINYASAAYGRILATFSVDPTLAWGPCSSPSRPVSSTSPTIFWASWSKENLYPVLSLTM